MEVEFDLLKQCREAISFAARQEAIQKLREGATVLLGQTVAISVIGGEPFAKGKVVKVETPTPYLHLPLSVEVLREADFGGDTIWLELDKHIIMVSQ